MLNKNNIITYSNPLKKYNGDPSDKDNYAQNHLGINSIYYSNSKRSSEYTAFNPVKYFNLVK
jgi:hypothetical protein